MNKVLKMEAEKLKMELSTDNLILVGIKARNILL